MRPSTEVWFEGELSPDILLLAGGLSVEHRGEVTILWGPLTPSRLRRLVDTLVDSGHRIVDVAGAPIESAER